MYIIIAIPVKITSKTGKLMGIHCTTIPHHHTIMSIKYND